MTILWGGGVNWKMRFASKVDDKGRMWISSWAGHSEGFEENDGDMPVNRGATSIGHGTEWIHLDSITDLGLSRCAREHIDMSNADRQEVDMAYLKRSAEILSSIDAAAAREGEMRFYNANNGIIVSRASGVPSLFASLHRSLISGREESLRQGRKSTMGVPEGNCIAEIQK